MKGKTLSAIGLIALIAGLAIAIFYRSITTEGVVITGGVLFMAVGVSNLIIYGSPSRQASSVARVFSQISNAAAIVLGICMLVFQSTFVPLVAFIFGLLVAVLALWQFFLLAIGTRPYQLHGWLYAFPLLLTGAAIYVFVKGSSAGQEIMLVTGIAVAVMGVGCFCQGTALGMARRRSQRAEAPDAGLSAGGAPANAAEGPEPSPKHSADDAPESL